MDPFKDWTPEMIESFRRGSSFSEEHRGNLSRAMLGRTLSEEHRRNISEAQKKVYARKSLEELEEIRKKRSESMKATLARRTPEEQEEDGRRRIKVWEERRRKGLTNQDEGFRRKISQWSRRWWSSRTSEQLEEISRIWSSAAREHLSKLTKEELEARYNNSLGSDEAIRRRVKAWQRRPTMPEAATDTYLQRRFPNIWAYNGDYSQGISIGKKIPDFIRLDGKKEVIEVLGGVGYFHFLEEEKEKIEHYAKFGYRCIVVWEWDVYSPDELDNKI